MQFLTLGISHKTCAVDIRERFYLNEIERELLLSQLKSCPEISEALIISTCNRTELYASAHAPAKELLIKMLCQIKKQPLTDRARNYFTFYTDDNAVRHLLRVSAGLESLVIGEKEILGQIKTAFELSRRKKFLGRTFNILANITLRTGKLARSHTAIGNGGHSVSWAAVEMANKNLGTLKDKSVLIIGAGKMSHLAAGGFQRKGVKELYIVNRTLEKSKQLAAKFNGIPAAFSEVKELFPMIDVCICSASAPHYILEKTLIEECMRTRLKPLLLIDISMPRNIHPGAAEIKGVSLASMDDLGEVIKSNIQLRQNSVKLVEEIIDRKIDELYKKLNAAPILVQERIKVMYEAMS